MIIVDVNGFSAPNKTGIDQFYFYIFPVARRFYNTGKGDCAINIPTAGVYYDGYGIENSQFYSDVWRGCVGPSDDDNTRRHNAYCIALIARNNWKIPANYPFKF